MRWLYAALTAWTMGGGMAVHLVPAANQWRGCWAIGGEWLLVALAAAAGWQLGWALALLVEKAEKKPACGSSRRRAKGCEVVEASHPECNTFWEVKQ